MPESPPTPAPSPAPIEAAWRSDSTNQIRLAAWQIQRVRRSKAFSRYRTRQLIAVHAWMLIPAAALCFVFSTLGGSFPRLLFGTTAFLVVFALFLILRGGKITTPAALRLAANLDRAGALPDTSGDWRFHFDGHEASWEWLDRGWQVSWPADRLDPPEEFDGTLIFSSAGVPAGLVPRSALTTDQQTRLLASFSMPNP